MVMVAERSPGNPSGRPLPFLQFPRMTGTDNIVKKKLIFKICTKGVRVDSGKESYKCDSEIEYGDENKKLNMNTSVRLPLQGHNRKRGSNEMLGGPKEKRQKMDRSIRQQCDGILKELMNHKHGWPFNQPVDPVAYNIPDYFSIVTKPMDLGTIRSKLENYVYLRADEFAADVRLTFSNCMLYNPPHNGYHCMAKELNTIFNRRWKMLEAKLKHISKSECVSNGSGEGAEERLQMYPSHVSSVNRRTMSLEEKQDLSKELKEMLKGKMAEKLESVLKKYNLCSLKQLIDVDINTIDDEILWELKRMVKSSLNLTAAKLQHAKMTKGGALPLSRKVIDKGTESDSRISCGASNGKPQMSSVNSKCGSCGNLTCRCGLHSSKAQAFSIGAGSAEEDNVCVTPVSSVCCSNSMSDGGGTPVFDVRLSPKNPVRAAMLISRFADTIFKANNKTLLNQGEKTDPVKLLLEKERLQKQQREREREAARIALQQMEKSVVFEDNLKILKDLEMLCQSSTAGGLEVKLDTREGGHVENPLEWLGLYLKEDFIEDDDEEAFLNGDKEEGEIL